MPFYTAFLQKPVGRLRGVPLQVRLSGASNDDVLGLKAKASVPSSLGVSLATVLVTPMEPPKELSSRH